MLEKIYTEFKEFILNDKLKIPVKLVLTSVVILGLLSIDYFFRLSDTYITNTKIQQIEKIEALLQNKSLGVQARVELIRIEKNVIDRQGLWDSLSDFTSRIQAKINSINANNVTNINTRPIREISVFWHYFTSGWPFWIFILISPTIFFAKGTSVENVIAIILIDIVCMLLALFFAYILLYIPVFFDPIVNYILNIVISFLPFYYMLRIEKKMGEAKS